MVIAADASLQSDRQGEYAIRSTYSTPHQCPSVYSTDCTVVGLTTGICLGMKLGVMHIAPCTADTASKSTQVVNDNVMC